MSLFQTINSSVRRLAHIKRYSTISVNRNESVAEHSYYCALIAHQIALMLKSRGLKVDANLVAAKSLYHDIEESLTGDIMRTFKHRDPKLKSHIGRVSGTMMKEMMDHEFKFTNADTYDLWMNSKDDSIEGKIVGLADLLCVVAYVREEMIMGNQYMDSMAEEIHKILKSAYSQDEVFAEFYNDIYPSDHYTDINRRVDMVKLI